MSAPRVTIQLTPEGRYRCCYCSEPASLVVFRESEDRPGGVGYDLPRGEQALREDTAPKVLQPLVWQEHQVFAPKTRPAPKLSVSLSPGMLARLQRYCSERNRTCEWMVEKWVGLVLDAKERRAKA